MHVVKMVSKLPIFPIEDYLIKEPLGSGAFGTVLLYEKKQSHSKLSTGTPKKVALKMFYLKDVNNFDTELEHMKTIGKTTPNVVMFLEPAHLIRPELAWPWSTLTWTCGTTLTSLPAPYVMQN